MLALLPRQFLQNLYATEGSSLVLACILFVRFFEDHDMTIRKISNGGIRAFRQYHRYLKAGKCGSILTTIFSNYEEYDADFGIISKSDIVKALLTEEEEEERYFA